MTRKKDRVSCVYRKKRPHGKLCSSGRADTEAVDVVSRAQHATMSLRARGGLVQARPLPCYLMCIR